MDNTEIKKVPSDPHCSLSSNRHARSGRGIHIVREENLLLPAIGFRQLRITDSEIFRKRPERNRFLRSGLLLTYSDFRLATIASVGSTLPAYFFKIVSNRWSTRSVSNSLPHSRFAVNGEAHRPTPVVKPRIGNSSTDTLIFAPRQDFYIPSDRSAPPVLSQESLPRRTARSSFAPRHRFRF
jgi:hypothetical protein